MGFGQVTFYLIRGGQVDSVGRSGSMRMRSSLRWKWKGYSGLNCHEKLVWIGFEVVEKQ